MSWGRDLWDQLENLDKHTQWGIDTVEKHAKFVRERMEIEQIYVKQLRNLVKKFCAKQSKEEEMRFSTCLSFHTVLNEVNNYAEQRETVAQELGDKVYDDLLKYLQELKNDRKQYIQDGREVQHNIEQRSKQMEASKKKFEQDWKEAQKLQLKYERLDSSMNVTKADVEKAKNQLSTQLQVVKESKNEYADVLRSFNEEQRKYFSITVVQVFKNLQEMDERRSARLAESFKNLGQLEQRVSPAISRCFQGMVNAGTSVDPKKDSEMVVEIYKSGVETPGDNIFEDFTQVPIGDRADSACSVNMPSMEGVLPDKKLTLSKAKNKLGQWKRQIQIKTSTPNKSSVPQEDYNHLPSEQSHKKLKQKIDELYKELHVEMNHREGLMKMKEVCHKNLQLGDTSTMDARITETVANLDRLRAEISKTEKWLFELEVKQSADARRHYSSEGNLYTPYGTESPENSIYEDVIIVACQDSDDNVNPPLLARCRALYAFDGQSEGSLVVKANEMLQVIEKDKGDGWMQVRNCSGCEGYVPTSYLEIRQDPINVTALYIPCEEASMVI
ncbi:formin-binding protein 1-like [Arapaima gigas]